MNFGDVINENAGKLGTAIGSIGASAIFIFKQWREDRREDKDFDSREKVIYELINMIKQDLLARNQTDQYILQVMRDNAASLAQLSNGMAQLILRDKQGG